MGFKFATARAACALVAGITVCVLLATNARSETISVNSTTDAPASATALSAGVCADAAGACTLRAAVQLADAVPVPSTIVVPAGTYNLMVTGTDEAPSSSTSPTATVVHTADAAIGDLNLTRSMAIVGAGAEQTIIQWDPAIPQADRDRVFHVEAVDSNIAVSIEGVTIANGYTPAPVVLSTMSATAVVEFMRFGGGIASGPAASVETVNPQATHGQGSGGAGSEGHGGHGGEEGESGFAVDQLTLDSVHVLGNEAGSDGGGIYSAAPLMLLDSIVNANTAGANGGGLYNDAALTMSGTTIGRTATSSSGNAAENGGGVFDTGFHTSEIEKSAIVGNTATGGGGIAGRRLVLDNITNTTIAENTAQDTGGGVTTNGRVVLTNSTIANNVVASDTEGGGAGLNGFGPASGGATGGGANGATYTLVNTILSGNVLQGTTTVVSNCGATGEGSIANRFYSLGHNLENGDTCSLSGTGDLVNTDPLLKALANNGGPTETMALSSVLTTPADAQSSPAIDAGDNAYCPNNDQRGELRPADGNLDGTFVCDIGAFELFIPTADLHINDMSGPNSVFVGDPFDVSVEIHVDPAATASSQGVVLTTGALPTDLALNSATVVTPSGTNTCSVAASVVTCNAGTLQPDQTATMDLNLTAVNPSARMTITAHVTQTSPADPDLGNNTAQLHVTAVGLSNLAVTASGVTTPVDVGSDTDLSFTVSNAGPHDAAPVTFGMVLSTGVTYASVTIAGGTCDTSDPTAILCTLPSIAAGSSASGTLTVTGTSEGPASIEFGAYAPQRDDAVGDNTATVTLAVQGLSDLGISGAFAADVIGTGDQDTLSLNIVNNGPTDATSTRVVTQLPSGLSFKVSASGSTCAAGGGTVTCDVGTVAAGQSATVAFTVTASANSGTLKVTSSVSSDKSDPDMSNNTMTSAVSVLAFSGGGGGAFGFYGLGILAAATLVLFLRKRRAASRRHD